MRADGNALGHLLQDRRRARGYSRARVADAVGMRPGTIEGWELGRVSKPPIHDVLRLARFLGISSGEIEDAVFSEEARPEPASETSADGAVPLLEQAIALFGWTVDEAAAALGTTPTVVESWRTGSVAMNLPELMTVAALLGLHAARASGSGTRIADLRDALAQSSAPRR